jgi:hypothetical protein
VSGRLLILTKATARSRRRSEAETLEVACKVDSRGQTDQAARMFQTIGRFATIVALCLAVGVHWVALQSMAWTTMICEYSKDASLLEAVSKTFDGNHPCSLCHAVNNGKNSEKKSEFQARTLKIDMVCSFPASRLPKPFVSFDYTTANFPLSENRPAPPVPPPRALVA